MDTQRLERIGQALEAFVVWARVLDSRRTFPFGEIRLTRAQWETLFFIAHAESPVRPSGLADVMGVTRGAVTQLVAGLLGAGLIDQGTDPRDARRRMLMLSGDTRVRVDGFERELATGLAPRFADLDDQELARLTELLRRTKGAR